MKVFRSLAVIAVIATGIATTGCNVFRGESTAGQYVDDVAITAKVKAKLLDSGQVDGLDVDVNSLNGRVTLSGWASSTAESKKATQLAASVDGVRSVNNQLKIKS
jgi:osmotically-inducible protein OsmY